MKTLTLAVLLVGSLAFAKVIDVSGADSVVIRKLPVKNVVKATPAPQTTQLPNKLPAKRVAKKPATNPDGLATQLPAFKGKKIKINFDDGATPSSSDPAIVIRDRDEAPATTDVQSVKPREVKEASYLERIEDDEDRPTQLSPPDLQAGHILKPALPDSDSFVNVPGRATLSRRMPPTIPAPAISAIVAAPDASIEQLRADATAVVDAAKASVDETRNLDESPKPKIEAPLQTTAVIDSSGAAEPTSILTSTAKPMSVLPSYWPYSAQDGTAVLTQSAIIQDTPTESAMTQAKSESESSLDAEKGAEETAYTKPSTPVMKTTFLIPHDEIPRRRLFVRTGFLDAHYSEIESDLKNGATVFGVSVSQVFSKTEVRLGLDVAHGLDQAVNLRNTRMAMFRAEGLYHFAAVSSVRFFGGGALGVADIDVTSYHAVANSGDVVVRENAKGTALLAAPEIGARILIGRDISLDLAAQYLLLTGGDQISKLGGLLGEAALGFTF